MHQPVIVMTVFDDKDYNLASIQQAVDDGELTGYTDADEIYECFRERVDNVTICNAADRVKYMDNIYDYLMKLEFSDGSKILFSLDKDRHIFKMTDPDTAVKIAESRVRQAYELIEEGRFDIHVYDEIFRDPLAVPTLVMHCTKYGTGGDDATTTDDFLLDGFYHPDQTFAIIDAYDCHM